MTIFGEIARIMKNNKTISSILHLICGLPGSGKTTLAKKLEKEHSAIRFCPDEWIKDIWSSEEVLGNQYRDEIEHLQWKIGRNILQNDIDIIIEWGTWGKKERKKIKEEAWKIGSKVKFYYLNIPKEILKERIVKRNKNLDNSELLMPDEKLDKELDRCFKLFEIPTKKELESYDFLG